MTYQDVPLNKLVINRANDRHGELENETAAIAWLFNEREAHMKNLAADIAKAGLLYEPPLVSPDNGTFIVFDGNRRMTCIKLIDSPRRAPTVPLQEYFEKLKAQWHGTFPLNWQCQVEEDTDHIDEILFRRHTGVQTGIGQSTWDDRMKLNFTDRTGRQGPINVAAEIEKILEAHGMAPKSGRIPRSNFNRLLSAEPFRARVGFTVRNRKIEFTHEQAVVLAALSRIANDMISKEVVLGDIWNVDGKRDYLNKLEAQAVLPSAVHALKSPAAAAPAPPKDTPRVRSAPAPRPEQRTTLIPQKVYSISWPGKLQRVHAIWDELQFKLQLRDHPNAISVLLRVLIELSVDNYIAATRLHTISKNDALKHKIDKIAGHLHTRDKITEKYRTEVSKICHGNSLMSVGSLNSYIHSSTFAPAQGDLCAMWDTIADFIVHCLNE